MSWGADILRFFTRIRSPILNNVFEVITISTESGVLLLVIAIIYWCVNKKLGQKLGSILLFSMTVNGLIKNIAKVARPFDLEGVVALRKHTATGYSFPSGHTQAATTFWSIWMMHVAKRWLYYFGTIMIALIGLSRIYLGVHWPMDIMGAIVIGMICSAVGQRLFQQREHPKATGFLLGGCALLWGTLFLGFDADYVKAVGGLTGFLIGTLLEERYIGFNTKASLGAQVKKVAIGILGLGIIYGTLKLISPPYLIFSFIRYALLAIWFVAGAPYVFKIWNIGVK